ncbi:conserved hypothetical protein [Ixodes scapularis]|uniref:Uncharacterized protein n=1 Tax=Ixodes scapularis TaxID=6945 RepID=B7PQE1_IXOSC|nr:conserved hypothetical protein [Ixodes scapularis]|eukprot:XP_002435983.1 conserved hypothetical protein [Ixodes scapularis]
MASLGWRSGGNTPDVGLSEMTLVLDVNPYVRYPLVSFNILFWLLGLGFIFTGVYAYFDAWTNPPASGRFKLDYNIYRHVESSASSVPLSASPGMASLGWRSGGNTPDVGLSEMTLVLDVNPYVRYSLVSFNILFWLLGLGFIFTGVYAYFDSLDQSARVRQEDLKCCGLSDKSFRDWNDNMYFNCSRSNPSYERCSVPHSFNELMNYGRRSVMLVNIETTVTVVGAVLVSVSFCGCVGALRENTCLLSTYSHVVTALLLLNLILGLLVFFLPSQVKRTLRSTLSSNLVLHYRDNPDLQWIIDSIQVKGSSWEAKRCFRTFVFGCDRMRRTRW